MPKRTPLKPEVEDLEPINGDLSVVTEAMKERWVELTSAGMPAAAAAAEIGVPYAALLEARGEDPVVQQALEMSVLSTTRLTRTKQRIVRQGSYSYKSRILANLLDGGPFLGYLADYTAMADPTIGKAGSRERARAEERFEFLARHVVVNMMPKESATRVINEVADSTPKSIIEIESELVELEIEEKTIHARIAHAGRTRRESAARLAGGSGSDQPETPRLEEGETGVAEVG